MWKFYGIKMTKISAFDSLNLSFAQKNCELLLVTLFKNWKNNVMLIGKRYKLILSIKQYLYTI